MTDPHVKKKWLAALAKLVSPAFPTDAADALAAFLPFLDDIPPEAFTRRSLEAVVAAKRRQSVPSLDELRVPLLDWWRANQQHVNRLLGPSPSLTQMDYSWIKYWQTRKREGFCPCQVNGCMRREERLSSLIRSMAPKAWAKICEEEAGA